MKQTELMEPYTIATEAPICLVVFDEMYRDGCARRHPNATRRSLGSLEFRAMTSVAALAATFGSGH